MAISDLAYIDATGFHFPDYPTVLAALQADYRLIYGQDVYLEADSQDGQWVAVQALAQYELMALAAAVYNSFSPATALSDALSRNVKINGIRRRTATRSTVDLLIVGQTGTVISNGVAEDTLSQRWLLPASVTIPLSGQIVATATAQELGAYSAAANTIKKISTPTLGWQTVNNPAAATVGAPVETDAQLRARQTRSTSLGSLSVMDGTAGAVAAVAGVVRSKGYENDTNVTNADGIPANKISFFVQGGDSTAIAQAIALHKTPGSGTFGTTSAAVYDAKGMPNTINFFRPAVVPIKVALTLKPFAGYSAGYADLVKQALAAFVNALDIGDDVFLSKMFAPANLTGNSLGSTFNVSSLQIARLTDSFAAADVVIAFNEAASLDIANIAITVSP